MTGKTIAACWVAGVRDLLLNAGLDAAAVFRDADLDLEALKNPEMRYTPDQVSRLWEVAAERSGDPAIGLRVRAGATPAQLDAIAYVMMSSPNLLLALERLLRYTSIISNAADLALVEVSGGRAMTVKLASGNRPVPRQRVEFVMATTLHFCRWISGRHFSPVAVDFADPEPDDVRPYQEAFNGPLRFNAPLDRIVFSDEDLATALPTSNPVMAEVHDRLAIERLSRLDDHAKVTHRARELIIRSLPDGDPSRAEIAKALCMSERTLLRRLQEEGGSYHQLLDGTRLELATQYLQDLDLALAQITYLLGFNDQSTFSRACKRWFDVSPSEYRSNLKK